MFRSVIVVKSLIIKLFRFLSVLYNIWRYFFQCCTTYGDISFSVVQRMEIFLSVLYNVWRYFFQCCTTYGDISFSLVQCMEIFLSVLYNVWRYFFQCCTMYGDISFSLVQRMEIFLSVLYNVWRLSQCCCKREFLKHSTSVFKIFVKTSLQYTHSKTHIFTNKHTPPKLKWHCIEYITLSYDLFT